MRQYIKWTDQEKTDICTQMVSIFIDNVGISFTECYKKAINILPPDRKRSTIAPIQKELSPIIKELMYSRCNNTKTTVEVVEVEKIIHTNISDIETEQLTMELTRRFLSPFIEKLVSRVVEDIRPAILNSIKATIKEKDNKIILKKILIIGLLPEQQQEIIKEFNECFTLTFFKNKSFHLLESQASHSDLVIMMSKFISHSHKSMIDKCKVNYKMCNGGISDLKTILEHEYMK